MRKRSFVIIILLLLIFSISFIIFKNSNFVNAAVVNGTFTTQNEAPGRPSGMSIQQFILGQPNDFDSFDINDDGRGVNISDTHMVYNSTPSPQLTWTQGTDPNNDPVRTLLCISTSAASRNSVTTEQFNNLLCNVVNNFTNATAETPSFIFKPINFNFFYNLADENISYYVRMRTIEVGTSPLLYSNSFYDANITVRNSRPNSPTSLAGSVPAINTHSRTPILNWLPDPELLDPDNGTWVDHYPLDNVTYIINITDVNTTPTQTLTTYLYTSVLHSSQFSGPWVTSLTYGTSETTPGIVNKNYKSIIEARDWVLPSISNYTANFDLFDNIPDVQFIEITDEPVDISVRRCPGSCSLTPVLQSNVTNMLINVYTTDADADCTNTLDVNNAVPSTNFSINAHLCVYSPVTGGLACNEVFKNFTFKPNRINGSGTTCNFTFSSRIGPSPNIGAVQVALPGTIPFFIAPAGGSYPPPYFLYVNVTSHSGVKRSLAPGDPEATTNWTYRDNEGVIYINETNNNVEEVILGTGGVTLGVFNPGTREYNFTNVGNIIVDFQWNASNAFCVTIGTCDANTWNLVTNPNRFLLDDEGVVEFLTGALEVGIGIANLTNPGLVYFNFTTGLERCISHSCVSPTTNEVMPTHFHINPPSGLGPGTYRSIITYLLNRGVRVQHI